MGERSVLPRILVTGANGFVGKELCAQLRERGYHVVPTVRAATDVAHVAVGEIHESTLWSTVLQGVDVVIHLAARVHVMNERHADREAAFERINVGGSRRLAQESVVAGVKRFVFVSSIKVNGEATHSRPYVETDVPQPEDAYGRSKLAAERVLVEISRQTGLELVIVRPPMVIGPGAKGNLPVLMRALLKGLPLPLGAVRNRRNVVGVRNLARLLELCALHSAAGGEIFLAADEPALNTPALIAGLAQGLGRTVRLLPMPVTLLRMLASAFGMGAEIKRLTGDLEIDSSKARNQLGWVALESLDEALRRTGEHYLNGSELQP